MKVQVTVNGKTNELEVDFDSLTLRQSVALQRTLGDKGWDEFTSGVVRPATLQAVIWVKLREFMPDIQPDDFDLTFEAEDAQEANPTSAS